MPTFFTACTPKIREPEELSAESSSENSDQDGDIGDNNDENDDDEGDNNNNGVAILAVATGSMHTCAILNSGKLKCWGYNASGRLGRGTDVSSGEAPGYVVNTGETVSLFDQVSAGFGHTCARSKNDYKVRCWGFGANGQLGNGMASSSLSSPAFGVYAGAAFNAISAGGLHTCALGEANQNICWGDTNHYQLGDGSNGGQQNSPVTNGSYYSNVSAGYAHTCAVETGILKCWGKNDFGQVGNGTADINIMVPTAIDWALTYVSVSAGINTTCAITNMGILKCWGNNSHGQVGIGDGGNPHYNVPQTVNSGESFKSVSVGGNHACAISTNDHLYCWGNNNNYELGTGNNYQNTKPALIDAANTYKSVSVADYVGTGRTCAIRSNDKLYCWGNNTMGAIDLALPGTVSGITEIILSDE